MNAETDYLLGRVLEAAKAAGVYDNCWSIFLSDHGEMNMEHRQARPLRKAEPSTGVGRHPALRPFATRVFTLAQVWKNSLYEPSARVPMVISAGRVAGAAN